MLKGEETRFILMSLMIVVTVKAAVITLSPVSVTTTLNTVVNFTCEGTGEQLFWRVQALLLSDSSKKQRHITVTDFEVSGNLSSLLTITALPINNGISIACHIYSFKPSFQQELSGGTLTIRGVSQVEDIQWSIALQTLSWLPPTFYSDDIPQGEKPVYNVLVNGISVSNTTGTSLWLNISSCTTEFNVSIVSSIDEYQSTAMEYSVDNTGVYNISIVNYTLIFNETSKYFYVELLNFVQSNNQFCDIAIIGKIESWEEYADKYYSPETISTDMRETDVLYIMDGLEPCKTYTAVVSVINTLKNIIENEDNVNITSSPNGIQDVVLSTEGNGSVRVQCVYAESSTADGFCHVIFTHTTTGRKKHFNITSDDSTLISLPTNGVYTVTAYAITNMIIVPWSCVQPKEVALNITFETALDLYSSSWTNGITSRSSIIDTTDTFYVLSTMAVSVLPTVPSSQSTLSASIVILSMTFGGLLLVLMLLIITISVAVWCLRKRNKKFKGPIMDNPAYGQVVELQRQRPSRVRTEVNPAYETVLPHAKNALYESVL